jgi:hypothetical protein
VRVHAEGDGRRCVAQDHLHLLDRRSPGDERARGVEPEVVGLVPERPSRRLLKAALSMLVLPPATSTNRAAPQSGGRRPGFQAIRSRWPVRDGRSTTCTPSPPGNGSTSTTTDACWTPLLRLDGRPRRRVESAGGCPALSGLGIRIAVGKDWLPVRTCRGAGGARAGLASPFEVVAVSPPFLLTGGGIALSLSPDRDHVTCSGSCI